MALIRLVSMFCALKVAHKAACQNLSKSFLKSTKTWYSFGWCWRYLLYNILRLKIMKVTASNHGAGSWLSSLILVMKAYHYSINRLINKRGYSDCDTTFKFSSCTPLILLDLTMITEYGWTRMIILSWAVNIQCLDFLWISTSDDKLKKI